MNDKVWRTCCVLLEGLVYVEYGVCLRELVIFFMSPSFAR